MVEKETAEGGKKRGCFASLLLGSGTESPAGMIPRAPAGKQTIAASFFLGGGISRF